MADADSQLEKAVAPSFDRSPDGPPPRPPEPAPELVLSYSSSISYDGSEASVGCRAEEETEASLEEVRAVLEVYLDEVRALCALLDSLDAEQRGSFFSDRELARKLDYIRSKTFASFLSSEERLVCVVELIVGSDLPAFYLRFLAALSFADEVVAQSRCRKVTNFIKCQTVVWNVTDKSAELCARLLQGGLPARVFPLLREVAGAAGCLDTTNVRLFTKGLLGILYNLVQKLPSARAHFRVQQGVRILRDLVATAQVAVKTGCLLLLSHIVDECENDFLNATDDNIRYVLAIFRECGRSDTRHSKEFGYHGLEMLQGLKAVAAQDRNKEKLVRNGLLALLEDYSANHGAAWSHDEELAVYELLWSLAYDDICRRAILQRQRLMRMTTAASERGRSVLIRRAASGALWKVHDVFGKRQRRRSVLGSLASPMSQGGDLDSEADDVADDDDDDEEDDDDVLDSAVDGDAEPLPCQIKREHIFISYSHTTQRMMLRVRDRLRDAGYTVWMDVDYMVGSTIESMATAVEGAAIVMFGMCQRFKDSPHCRAELEYAYRLQKPMLPLVMEADFKADGWLGFLCGSKLTYDMFEEEHLEKNLACILKELGGRGKPSCADSAVKCAPCAAAPAPPPPPPEPAPCKAPCCKEASTDTTDGFATDLSGLWVRQEGAGHSGSAGPVKAVLSNGPGCLGCGRLQAWGRRFAAWDAAAVAAWFGSMGLEAAAARLPGLDGRLLVEWQRMRCSAPEFFYRCAREDLSLGLVDLLRLTRGLAELCEDPAGDE